MGADDVINPTEALMVGLIRQSPEYLGGSSSDIPSSYPRFLVPSPSMHPGERFPRQSNRVKHNNPSG